MDETLLKFASRIAFRMTPDPEAQSLAASACWRAVESYDETTGVPLRRYVAVCVKRAIWDRWRSEKKRREEQKDEAWWSAVVELPPHSHDLVCAEADWQVLVDRFVRHVPLDVIGRRFGESRNAARRRVAAALSRFLEKVQL